MNTNVGDRDAGKSLSRVGFDVASLVADLIGELMAAAMGNNFGFYVNVFMKL